ncbi:TPA: PorV/PorQ family protein [bacterium]|nr:PorV/PorQ family protein [bacterium]
MRIKNYSLVFAIFVVIFVPCFVSASVPDGIGTQDAAFLKIDSATRPVAMGGAFVGLANDVNAVFWNPAGLTHTEKKELTTMYNSWIAGINTGSIAYSQPISKNATLALSMQGLWADIEERIEDTEKPEGTFGVYSYAAGLSGSYALIPKIFSLGGTAKFINQEFDIDSASGVAVDFGGLINLGGLGVGFALQNLKIQSSNDADLPMFTRVGASYYLTKDSVVAGEYSKLGVAEPSYHIGVEKWFKGVFALRVGYEISAGDNPSKGVSAGFGLKAYGTKPLEDVDFQLDYAYVPAPDWGSMGDTHRISMIIRF